MNQKALPVLAFTLLAFLTNLSSGFSQLTMRGVIYSDGIVKATIQRGQTDNRQALYLYAPQEKINKNDTTYTTKYEVPGRLVKNKDYILRFTDGTVEKIVYVSGAIPESIVPKQKFRIDIDLTDHPEPEMTLIVFWSISQSSYRALPLSKLDEIKSDAPIDFFWDDGSAPDHESRDKSGF